MRLLLWAVAIALLEVTATPQIHSHPRIVTTSVSRADLVGIGAQSFISVELGSGGDPLTWPSELSTDLPLCVHDPADILDGETAPHFVNSTDHLTRREVFHMALRASVDILQSACGIGLRIVDSTECVPPELSSRSSEEDSHRDESSRGKAQPLHSRTQSHSHRNTSTPVWLTVTPWPGTNDGRAGSAPVMQLLQRWRSGFWGKPVVSDWGFERLLSRLWREPEDARALPWSTLVPLEEGNKTTSVVKQIPEMERMQAKIYVASSLSLSEMTRVMSHELGHALGFLHPGDESNIGRARGVYSSVKGKVVSSTGSDLSDGESFMGYGPEDLLMSTLDEKGAQFLYGPPRVDAPLAYVQRADGTYEESDVQRGVWAHAFSTNVSTHSYSTLRVNLLDATWMSSPKRDDAPDTSGPRNERMWHICKAGGMSSQSLPLLVSEWQASGHPSFGQYLQQECVEMCNSAHACDCEVFSVGIQPWSVHKNPNAEVVAVACQLSMAPRITAAYIPRERRRPYVLAGVEENGELRLQLDGLATNWAEQSDVVTPVKVSVKHWASSYKLKLTFNLEALKFSYDYRQSGSLGSRKNSVTAIVGSSVSLQDLTQAIAELDTTQETKGTRASVSLRLSNLAFSLSDVRPLAKDIGSLDIGETNLGPTVDISNLLEIESVKLDHNGLTDLRISTDCVGATNQSCPLQKSLIRTLDLSHNEFRTFPSAVLRLEGLRYLRLHSNLIKRFPSSMFESSSTLASLKHLSLQNNMLTTIPGPLWTLPRLRYVDVSSNFISELEIRNCSSKSIYRPTRKNGWAFNREHGLETLIASSNLMTRPPSFAEGCARMLKELDIAFNRISDHLLFASSVPTGPRRDWARLESLNVEANNIASIDPSILRNSRSLRTLNLANNFLASFPDELESTPWLESLLLRNNRLSKLPGSLKKLNKLDNLDASGNSLVSAYDLPANLGFLNLARNKLTNFTMQGADGLVRLDVSDNILTTLPVQLRDVIRGLLVFDASHNLLEELPCRLSARDIFDASYNRLTKVCVPEGKVLVNFARNRIREIEAGPDWEVFQNFGRLLVDFSHNELESVFIEALRFTWTTGKVNFAHNRIRQLPLRALDANEVDLTHNEIIGFSDVVGYVDDGEVRWGAADAHHLKLDLRYNNFTKETVFVQGLWPDLEEVYAIHLVKVMSVANSGLDDVLGPGEDGLPRTRAFSADLLAKYVEYRNQTYVQTTSLGVPPGLEQIVGLREAHLRTDGHDLMHAPYWPNIERLTLRTSTFLFSFLEHMERLRALTISTDLGAVRLEKGMEDVRTLKVLESVRQLHLHHTGLPPEFKGGVSTAKGLMHLFPNVTDFEYWDRSGQVAVFPMLKRAVWKAFGPPMKFLFSEQRQQDQLLPELESVIIQGPIAKGENELLCRAPHLKKVDVSDIYFPDCELPASVEHLAISSCLGHLDLSKLTRLTRLRSFTVRRCPSIGPIPEALASFRHLEKFEVYSSGLTDVPDSLQNVPSVYIGYCPLNHIPKWLRLGPRIVIEKGQLSTIPSTICDAEVFSISIVGSNLTPSAISTAFQSCSQLKLLDLSDSRFLTGDAPLHVSKSLRRVYLNRCSMHEIPKFVGAKGLRTLLMSNNSVAQLDEGRLNGLRGLRHLDLSYNKLSSLPDLTRLRYLQVLNVSGNVLTSLSGEHLPAKVKHIIASHNRLTSMPHFQQFLSLSLLELDHNRISHFADDERVGISIQTLVLSYNPLQQLPSLTRWQTLRVVVRGSVEASRAAGHAVMENALDFALRMSCSSTLSWVREDCLRGKMEVLATQPLQVLVQTAFRGPLTWVLDVYDIRTIADANTMSLASLVKEVTGELGATNAHRVIRVIASLSKESAWVMQCTAKARLPRFGDARNRLHVGAIAGVFSSAKSGNETATIATLLSPEPGLTLGEAMPNLRLQKFQDGEMVSKIKAAMGVVHSGWAEELRLVGTESEEGTRSPTMKFCVGPDCNVRIWVRDHRAAVYDRSGPFVRAGGCLVEVVAVLVGDTLLHIDDGVNLTCPRHISARYGTTLGVDMFFLHKTM